MATNGTNHEEYSTTPQSSEVDGGNASSQNLPKDEVGWYFVEQYYTTLSKSPEKLHLFYSKKSQFVVGQEAKTTNVSVGRTAIQERIKELEFENCKIRISNVDSQGSDENIVIQVIGHTSNKAGEPKKFVQTFVLARQPSGYFVLNDILRYINEDDEEAEEAAPSIEEAPAPVEQEAVVEAAAEPEAAVEEEPAKEAEPVELDAVVIDQKLEDESAPVSEAAAPAVEIPAPEAAPEVEEPAPKDKAEPAPEPEATVQEVAEEEAKKVEEPKEPNPTPAVPTVRPQAPAVAEPEKPREPPKPMTWASRVAAGAGGAPRPVVPVFIPKTATPPAAPQARPPAPAAAQPAPAAQTTETAPAPAVAKDQGSEWQTAETRRQNRPQSTSAAPAEKEGTMAYIKYVTEKVRDDDLRSALASFGELAYFDINRQKNCAFVEFKTTVGYNAAVNANPHTVNGENIIVEQRRPKANAYGGSNYSATRGGAPGRGRGGFESGRTGGQGTGRGGYTGQNRGRGGAPRGRGAAQAGTA